MSNRRSFFIEPLEARIAPAVAAVFPVSSLNGLNGFRLSGVAEGDQSGRSVSDAGDVNGDGFDDLIIGAPNADPNGSYSGASYVVFGKASGFAANLNLSTLTGVNGFKISGASANNRAGSSVSAAGDMNGDGFDDLIIGAPNFVLAAPPAAPGAAYVVFGKASGFAADLALSSLNGSNGFQITSAAFGDVLGIAVSGAGDVNRDGFADVIVGALGADPNTTNTGASYVIFGKSAGFAASLNVSALDGGNGFSLNGTLPSEGVGAAVSGAGDINGDGFDDVIIGAPNGSSPVSPFERIGASYVVFGKAGGFAASMNLSALNGSNGFKMTGAVSGDKAGTAVGTAGDLNGDGFDDMIIGAPEAQPNGIGSGASHVVFGKAAGFAASFSLSALDGSNGFALNGVAANDFSGLLWPWRVT